MAAVPALHAQWAKAAAQARAGDIAPLRLMALDVVTATADGQQRCQPSPDDMRMLHWLAV